MYILQRQSEGEVQTLTEGGHFLPSLLVNDPKLFLTEREANEWKTIHSEWNAYTFKYCNADGFHTTEDEVFAFFNPNLGEEFNKPSNLETVANASKLKGR